MLWCSAGKDTNTGLAEPIQMGLDDALEYIIDDELVEVCVLKVACKAT